MPGGRDFIRFWASDGALSLGAYIRLLAVQVLLVVSLHGSAFDVGLLTAARWLPYLLLGLVAGTVVDHLPRRSVLVWTDVLVMAVFAAMAVLAGLDRLTIPGLLALALVGGGGSLFHEAAAQAILPDLVPPEDLLSANVRLEQTGAAAQSIGPALAGVIIAVVGTPLAIALDAVAHLASGALNRGLSPAPAANPRPAAGVRREVRDGLRWVYGHRRLRSLALNTNLWFMFHAFTTTLLIPFLLLGLKLSPVSVGFVLAAAGIGSIAGTALSSRSAARWGAGRVIGQARALYLPSIVLLVLAPSAAHGTTVAAFGLAAAAELLYGFAMGLEGPLESAYRQSITPRALQGRTNATMRASNRAVVVFAAPLGGALAVAAGFRPALSAAALGMGTVAAWYAFSPMMEATVGEAGHPSAPGSSEDR